MFQSISLLGATGSIGRQTLEVCRALEIPVAGLSAHRNVKLLAEQIREFRPAAVSVADGETADALRALTPDLSYRLETGTEGLCELATLHSAGTVVNAVVGFAGLRPTLTALSAGKPVALANKETLVTGGRLVMEKAREKGVPVLPVDSEHSAIFQCMQGGGQVKSILLTASGGPFLHKTRDELAHVTVEQALSHPNWSMGAKITVDSATLMNKGLELIEACRLFQMLPEDIRVVVHPESVIHSMVEFADNAVLGQLGTPDMRLPIQYALTYPERMPCPAKRLDLFSYGKLTFLPPDEETFVCLAACKEAIRRGGLYPTLVNGANEAAVAHFLAGEISFLKIGQLVQGALELIPTGSDDDLSAIERADRLARDYVAEKLHKSKTGGVSC